MKRLSKALAAAGVASRRACEELIFDGKVSVNGEIVLLPQTLVSWEKDDISIDGETLKREQEKVYFMLNKPKGYICSSTRLGSKKLVVDLFAHLNLRLYTVGAEHLISISKGGLVENTWVKPANVKKVRRGTLTVSVHEGKKREVRLLVQKAGLDIVSLHRIRIGALVLGNLEVGEFRPLTDKEKQLLLKQ
jgi:23S rRNA pseudouridine2605 synthase